MGSGNSKVRRADFHRPREESKRNEIRSMAAISENKSNVTKDRRKNDARNKEKQDTFELIATAHQGFL
jgi:hypothetical protein